jgi:hypothetical protein
MPNPKVEKPEKDKEMIKREVESSETYQKREDVLKEKKKERAELAMSVKEQQEAKKYIENYSDKKVAKMVSNAKEVSIFNLQRGGSKRLAYKRSPEKEKKKIKIEDWEGYSQMTSMFSEVKESKNGIFLKVDLRENEKFAWKWGIGAGHICPPSWKRVAIEDTEGNIRTGIRKIPGKNGVYGEKVGYYENAGGEWKYIPIFTGYKIRPLEIDSSWGEKQAKKEEEYYQKREKQISDSGGIVPESSTEYIPDASKQDLIERGSLPFAVHVGYKLTPEEHRFYNAKREEAHKRARMNINERMDYMQKKYRLMDAIEYSSRMLNIRPQDKKMFIAFNDAVLRVESNYNPFCVNRRKDGATSRIALSTAAGEYQILNSTWNGRLRFFGNSRLAERNRRRLENVGINPDLVAKINMNEPRPELATPYKRAVYFNFFIGRYSRAVRGLEPIESVFDNIRNSSGRMRDSWMRIMYTYWRNGPGGAQPLVRNLRKGIPLPKTREEAKEYFANNLNPQDWQKERGFKDFWTLIRTTNIFKRRFERNLRELS